SPPGLILHPGTNHERVDSVVIQLMQQQGTLNGKKVAVLGETTSAAIVKNSVVPGLTRMGVKMGSTAVLSVAGTDTASAQSQLDSAIERWKSEGVNAVFVSGTQVASQQFIEKLRAQMPNVMLITDISDTRMFGQEETHAGRKPNPYEGNITATGPTLKEYGASANWQYCKD